VGSTGSDTEGIAASKSRCEGRSQACKSWLTIIAAGAAPWQTRAVSTIRPSRGRLRIYLGGAAGVGKTYQCLGDALLARDEGVDVVVGYLEPHGRQRTEDRARSLERAPVLGADRGRAETELDVDWLLGRRPTVAVVDELAHTNAAGSERSKRYEDVERLLDDGIDVWTTVNIQHLESLNDRIRDLTGVTVRETFPDRLIREAGEIRLVDLSPAALRERIARGLVYPTEQIDRALTGFFTLENLAGLRALALHELAEIAAADARSIRRDAAVAVSATERVLVAIGGRPESANRLIRAGERLAERSDAPLYVLVVEPQDGRISEETARVLDEAEALTRTLGGTFLRRRSDSPADQVMQELEAQQITQVVLGQTHRSRARRMAGRGMIDTVLRRSRGVDVHVVADSADAG
jgi:two-component system sensor histidine kinase KdpD